MNPAVIDFMFQHVHLNWEVRLVLERRLIERTMTFKAFKEGCLINGKELYELKVYEHSNEGRKL